VWDSWELPAQPLRASFDSESRAAPSPGQAATRAATRQLLNKRYLSAMDRFMFAQACGDEAPAPGHGGVPGLMLRERNRQASGGKA